MMRLLFLVLILIAPPALGEEVRVVHVIDGDTVILQDGRHVRLTAIQAPNTYPKDPTTPDWPLADQSTAALKGLIEGEAIRLEPSATPFDRHGRTLAQLYLPDGTWAQSWMLEHGWAFVYTFPDNRDFAAELLKVESEARRETRGLWGHEFYRVRTPDTVALNGYAIVEGTVVDAAHVGKRVYLNFGDDWRSDFTVRIERAALKLFSKAGVDPMSLEGQTLRVRGWVRSKNGPMIDVTHPEQIEVVRP